MLHAVAKIFLVNDVKVRVNRKTGNPRGRVFYIPSDTDTKKACAMRAGFSVIMKCMRLIQQGICRTLELVNEIVFF